MAQMNGSKFVLSNVRVYNIPFWEIGLDLKMAVAENQNDRYIFDRSDSEILSLGQLVD